MLLQVFHIEREGIFEDCRMLIKLIYVNAIKNQKSKVNKSISSKERLPVNESSSPSLVTILLFDHDVPLSEVAMGDDKCLLRIANVFEIRINIG